jgi:hypothetical protein
MSGAIDKALAFEECRVKMTNRLVDQALAWMRATHFA